MNEAAGIPLFSAYYKPFIIPDDIPCIHPVQAGRAIYAPLDMEGDNTGENISAQNPHFVELTALYYIWKNYTKENIPYFGFCHYRRYWMLDPQWFLRREVYYMKAEKESFEKIFSPRLLDTLHESLAAGKIILPRPHYMYKLKRWSVKQQYARDHFIESWDCMEDAVKRLFPAYHPNLVQFGKGLSLCLYNMMIADYDFWDGYLRFLFPVLFDVQQHYIIPEDPNQRRVFGFLAERLLNTYVLHHRQHSGLQATFLPVAHLS